MTQACSPTRLTPWESLALAALLLLAVNAALLRWVSRDAALCGIPAGMLVMTLLAVLLRRRTGVALPARFLPLNGRWLRLLLLIGTALASPVILVTGMLPPGDSSTELFRLFLVVYAAWFGLPLFFVLMLPALLVERCLNRRQPETLHEYRNRH